MADAVGKLVSELGFFFEPLGNSLESGADFGGFVRQFGIDIDGSALDGIVNALGPLRNGIFGLIGLADDLLDNGFQASDIHAVKTAAEPVFQLVSNLDNPFGGAVPAGMTAQQWATTLETLPEEMIHFLLASYLRRRLPIALQIFSLLDVYAPQQVPASGQSRSRGLPWRRENFQWQRIGQLFSDPGEWAAEAYGWGGAAFDSDKAITRLVETIEFMGGTADRDHMTDAQIAAFMPHLVGTSAPPLVALAPLWSHIERVNGQLDASTHAELGLMLMPATNAANTLKGFAVGPYGKGSAQAHVDLSSGMALDLTGNFGAAGGAVFEVLPSGLDLKRGIEATALNSAFGLEFSVGDPGGQGLILLGSADGTRVQIDAFAAKVGGEAGTTAMDFYLAAGVKKLQAVIAPSEDGILGAVLSQPIVIEAGDLLLGWRYSTGLYFEGGTTLGVTIPLDVTLGPIKLYEMGLELDLADNPTVTATVTADVHLGPIYAYADGLGLSIALVERSGGLLGNTHDLEFGFVAPTAYAVSLDAGPISGGGMLDVRDNEYRGALALKLTTIGISAFAILNTRLPDGGDGISFAGSIFAEFTVPLGFGFFLTGVGGFLGINRTLDSNAMRNVLYEGRLDNLLFPADPIAQAPTILQDMADILPAREGQYLFGPVARISFSQPPLVEATVGLILEFGQTYRIVILGGVAVNLPVKEAALVALNLSFMGEIDFAAETISFDATLQGSRVLAFPISGDIAIRTGWGPRLEHVASFGGLHPLFPRPANLPDLRRLSIGFGTNNPKVSLQTYIATTNNSLQFGARADVYFKGPKIWLVGRVAAEGWIYFDALVYFDPFAFDVRLGGGIRLLVDGKSKAELGFDLRLRGPNTFRLNGKVWVKIFGVNVDFGVDHTWGDRRSIPPPTVNAVEVLRTALIASGKLEALPPPGRVQGVGFAASDVPLIDPFGGVQLTQAALPLGIAIEKIGEAHVPGNANMLDIVVRRNDSTLVPVAGVKRDFVRGHFFAISDSERLSATAFDKHKCGFGFDAATLIGPFAAAITTDYGYEYIRIPVEEDSNVEATLTGLKALSPTLAAKFVGNGATLRASRIDQVPPKFVPTSPIIIKESVFVAAAMPPNVVAAGAAGVNATGMPQEELLAQHLAVATYTEASRLAEAELNIPDAAVGTNPAVAEYVALAAAL